MAKEINIPKDIVEKYEPKDIILYLTKELKKYNRESEQINGAIVYRVADNELQFYIDILSELNDKLNGSKAPNVII